jgi:hypothetical protein
LCVPISTTDQRQLVGIELMLYSQPSLQPLIASQQFIGGEDFRLYLNEYDVTAALKSELNRLVSALPSTIVRSTYLRGVTQYIQFASAFNSIAPNIAHDTTFAQNYAQLNDWDRKFDKLGDRHVGWSGNLHPLNFLYRFIPVQGISLENVWHAHRTATGGNLPETLRDFAALQVTFAEGPAPSFAAIDANFWPAGRLYYQLELAHANPLGPTLKQFASSLRLLTQELEGLRVNYLDPMSGQVQTLHTDLINHTDATRQALERLTQTVNNIG